MGQDQDSYGGGFEKAQSFVGEMTGVNIWNYVMSAVEISSLAKSCLTGEGNVVNWSNLTYRILGVSVVPISSCH